MKKNAKVVAPMTEKDFLELHQCMTEQLTAEALTTKKLNKVVASASVDETVKFVLKKIMTQETNFLYVELQDAHSSDGDTYDRRFTVHGDTREHAANYWVVWATYLPAWALKNKATATNIGEDVIGYNSIIDIMGEDDFKRLVYENCQDINSEMTLDEFMCCDVDKPSLYMKEIAVGIDEVEIEGYYSHDEGDVHAEPIPYSFTLKPRISVDFDDQQGVKERMIELILGKLIGWNRKVYATLTTEGDVYYTSEWLDD